MLTNKWLLCLVCFDLKKLIWLIFFRDFLEKVKAKFHLFTMIKIIHLRSLEFVVFKEKKMNFRKTFRNSFLV